MRPLTPVPNMGYRLTARIDFDEQALMIDEVMLHKEYDRKKL